MQSDEPLGIDEMTPSEMDDCELLLMRAKLRNEIARNPANAPCALTSRYRELHDEVDRRVRGLWS
jgi:hypothetical protein